MKDFQHQKKRIKNLNNFFRKKIAFVLYFLLFFALSLLATAALFDILLKQYVSENKLNTFSFDFSLGKYPALKADMQDDLTARAAVVMDSESKAVLFSKNPSLLFSMASTTKIMSALVGLEHYKMNDILDIKSANAEGVNVGFAIG